MIEEDLTRSVLGAFYDSYNKLGYGFLETVCVGALVIELQKRGHRVEREVPIAVYYEGVIIGSFRADLVVDNKLIVEVKAEPTLTGVHERQLRNYLAGRYREIRLIRARQPPAGSLPGRAVNAAAQTPESSTARRALIAPWRRRSP